MDKAKLMTDVISDVEVLGAMVKLKGVVVELKQGAVRGLGCIDLTKMVKGGRASTTLRY